MLFACLQPTHLIPFIASPFLIVDTFPSYDSGPANTVVNRRLLTSLPVDDRMYESRINLSHMSRCTDTRDPCIFRFSVTKFRTFQRGSIRRGRRLIGWRSLGVAAIAILYSVYCPGCVKFAHRRPKIDTSGRSVFGRFTAHFV